MERTRVILLDPAAAPISKTKPQLFGGFFCSIEETLIKSRAACKNAESEEKPDQVPGGMGVNRAYASRTGWEDEGS
uniref:Uncharacterized protein n=1 Tax=Salix viminalis TaxID=40686 RepID=A0A6N2LKF9_SALVM